MAGLLAARVLSEGFDEVVLLERDELEVAMALCGCATLAQAGPALQVPAACGQAR